MEQPTAVMSMSLATRKFLLNLVVSSRILSPFSLVEFAKLAILWPNTANPQIVAPG